MCYKFLAGISAELVCVGANSWLKSLTTAQIATARKINLSELKPGRYPREMINENVRSKRIETAVK